MAVPINRQDFERFIKLANLCFKYKDNLGKDTNGNPKFKGEIRIYVDGEYVSIELNGRGIPEDEVRSIVCGNDKEKKED